MAIRFITFLLFVVLTLPLRGTVILPPPSLASLAGTYFGSVSGTTLQRLTINREGDGLFADVWEDAAKKHVALYRVKTRRFRDSKIVLKFEPLNSEAHEQGIVASGTADSYRFVVKLTATKYWRKRRVVLHREEVIERLLQGAKEQMRCDSQHVSPDVVICAPPPN